MKTKVKMIRMVSGEYFIGTVCTDIAHNDMLTTDDNYIKLDDARVLTMQMTMKGAALGFAPVVPFAIKSPESISILKSMIMCEIEEENIQDTIVKGY